MGCDIMLYFGFILNILFYTISVLFVIGYCVLFFLKKNAILENFILIIFLASLVVIMGLSWSLVIMNQGFNVYLYIRCDYSYVLLIALPVVILYEVLDTFQRKKIQKSVHWYNNVKRYLLPVLTGILFFISTLVFYFNCHYYMFLKL